MTSHRTELGMPPIPPHFPSPRRDGMRCNDNLVREASDRIFPILRRAGERGQGTVTYLALMELRRCYPALGTHQLETLLQRAIKYGRQNPSLGQ